MTIACVRTIWRWVTQWIGIGFFGRYRVLSVVSYPVTLVTLSILTRPELNNTEAWAVLITISGGMTGAVAVLLEVIARMVMSGHAIFQKAKNEGIEEERRRWTNRGATLIGDANQGAVISVAATTPGSAGSLPLIVLTVNDDALAMSMEEAEQLADELPRTMRLSMNGVWWEMPSDAANRISVSLTTTARRARKDA
jgi:hypothetical protein